MNGGKNLNKAAAHGDSWDGISSSGILLLW